MRITEKHLRKFIRGQLMEDYQYPLFTPAHEDPGLSISIDWVVRNSVPDPLYDSNTNRLHTAGIPALIDGYINSNARGDGEALEDGIEAYADAIGIPEVEVVRAPGVDLKKGDTTYELKKSKTKKPNLMLNASFPKSLDSHFYVFLTNVPTPSQIKKAIKDFVPTETPPSDDENAYDEEEMEDMSSLPLFRSLNEEIEREDRLNQVKGAVPLFDGVRVYIVNSQILRLFILQSAFPGGGQGENKFFDDRTGEFTAEGVKGAVAAIKTELDKLGIEYKIAAKIAPALTKQLTDGLAPEEFNDGFDIKLGLLKVRIRLGIEPRTTVGDK